MQCTLIIRSNYESSILVNAKAEIIASSRGVEQVSVEEVDLAEANECRKSKTRCQIMGDVKFK